MEIRTEKSPALGRAMVVTNHPAASAAAAAMLAEGGTAIDAAVAGLLALTVCEPMMVGLFGGGMFHMRGADGTHTVLDGQSIAPAAAHATMFTPLKPEDPLVIEAVGRENVVGARSVAVPGNLLAWAAALEREGRFSLADVLQPAIRLARRGFLATPYLSECAATAGADLLADPGIAAIFMPDGAPVKPGTRVVNGALAETLETIAKEGPGALHGGSVGASATAEIAARGGILTNADLAGHSMIPRAPVRGTYRGYEVVLPPPPSAAGVHVVQMLNFLEGFDVAGLGSELNHLASVERC